MLNRRYVTPFMVWQGTPVDGHHPYAIFQERGIPFEVRQLDFLDLGETNYWMWQYHPGWMSVPRKTAWNEIYAPTRSRPHDSS